MGAIPDYDQWMKDTYSLTSPRSEFLKKLDESIKTHQGSSSSGAREAVKTALDRWRFEQSKQGKDWRKSVRNEKGAVTRLYRIVNDLDKRKLSKEELEAMDFIARSQAMALQKQFMGKRLRFKPNTLVGAARGASTKWEAFKAGASTVTEAGRKGRKIYNEGGEFAKSAGMAKQVVPAGTPGDVAMIRGRVIDFCRELCPRLDVNQVFSTLQLGSVDSFAADLAPFVGLVSSGGKAVMGWISVARRTWERTKLEDSRYAFAPGDPEAALSAVITLLDREIASETAKATARTAGFTGKVLGTFCDGGAVTGPVIGLLEVLAQVFQMIIEYVRDYQECEAGNEMLRVGALNLELFSVCPILGCYFLVIQDHSTIINFAVGDYGTPNWMFDVEKLVARIELTLKKSRQYIRVSRLEIPGMEHFKGVAEQSYSVKTGLGKVTGAPGALKEKIADRITAWFDKPEKLPKVDKSRIVGFGPKGGGTRP